jgi:hypothetical protein
MDAEEIINILKRIITITALLWPFIILILKIIFKFNTNIYLIILGLSYIFIAFIFITIIINSKLASKLNKWYIIKKYKQESDNPDTAIIIAKDSLWKLNSLILDSYEYNFKDYLRTLNLKKIKYKIFENITKKQFDEIIYSNKFKNIALFGHGTRHIFDLNPKELIYYCEYSNKNIIKERVDQFHCNHGGGKSLVEYLVKDPKKQKNCFITNNYTRVGEINNYFKKEYQKAEKKSK